VADDGAVADDEAVYSSLSRAVRNLMRLNTDWQVDLEKVWNSIWKGWNTKRFVNEMVLME